MTLGAAQSAHPVRSAAHTQQQQEKKTPNNAGLPFQIRNLFFITLCSLFTHSTLGVGSFDLSSLVLLLLFSSSLQFILYDFSEFNEPLLDKYTKRQVIFLFIFIFF